MINKKTGIIHPYEEIRGVHRREPVTWFLVADGSRGQVYVRQRVKAIIPLGGNTKHRHYTKKLEQELIPVAGMRWKPEPAKDSELGELKLRFMRIIATEIKIAHQQKRFDRLVLIAPPKLLGELKKYLSQPVLDQVIAELPKELAHYEGRDLAVQMESIV